MRILLSGSSEKSGKVVAISGIADDVEMTLSRESIEMRPTALTRESVETSLRIF